MPSEAMRPLLCLFAHPDDEFAVFAEIAAAIRAGRALTCIWLTDGGWGGQDRERRKHETTQVLGRLGVPAESMHFLGHAEDIADGALYLQLAKAIAAARPVAMAACAGGDLLMPAWEGGHADHDACHLAGLALAGDAGATAWQFPLYQGAGLPSSFFRVLAPLAANGQARVVPTRLSERIGHAGRCLGYRSQWRSFLGLLPFYALRMLRGDAFVLQPVLPGRTSERPHAGDLLYERRGGPTWEEFSSATAAWRRPSPDWSRGSSPDPASGTMASG